MTIVRLHWYMMTMVTPYCLEREMFGAYISTQDKFSNVFHWPDLLAESFGLFVHSRWARRLRVGSGLGDAWFSKLPRECNVYLFCVSVHYAAPFSGNWFDLSTGNYPSPTLWVFGWAWIWEIRTTWLVQWVHSLAIAVGSGRSPDPNRSALIQSRNFAETRQEKWSFSLWSLRWQVLGPKVLLAVLAPYRQIPVQESRKGEERLRLKPNDVACC